MSVLGGNIHPILTEALSVLVHSLMEAKVAVQMKRTAMNETQKELTNETVGNENGIRV
ncbi:hypothetical protein ABDH89_23735 [Paenibacillus naphthalenovorans]